MYPLLYRQLLSRLPAETAHELGISGLRGLAALPGLTRHARKRWTDSPCEVMGLQFPSRLGLAAGFDKNALAIDALGALGFGFVEIGTVTAQAQPGNPKPRLFRLNDDRALINRMGFNNQGAEQAAQRLAQRGRSDLIVGANIGKTKKVPAAEAAEDYRKSARSLAPHCDYLVVNVSSPNTPGLRDLQAVEVLEPILSAVSTAIDEVCSQGKPPLLVKIAPDLANEDIDALTDLATHIGLAGIIATNTTIARSHLTTPSSEVDAIGMGGLSGAPLKARSLEVLRRVRERAPEIALISVGGIETAEDAIDRLRDGADLVQAYTAFIFGGPLWPMRVRKALADYEEMRKSEAKSGSSPASSTC